jgi:UDP-glucuronate decarboxylase
MTQKNNIIEEDVRIITTNIGNAWDKIKGSKFLISGSNGLIGSYLVDTIKFLNDYYFEIPITVTCINRKVPQVDTRNFKIFQSGDKNFEFVSLDLGSEVRLKFDADYVIHAAGDSSPYKFQKNRFETINANYLGTRNLLNVARQNHAKKFLYFSSGSVYGEPRAEDLPIKESFKGNLSTHDQRACYAESKRLSETLCNVYDEDFNVPTLIARIFVVYGPGMKLDDNKVITDFIRSAISYRRIELKSDGSELRSDTYISDAICGLWKMILSNFRNEIMNVGSSYPPYSIMNLAKTIHAILGIDSDPSTPGINPEKYLSTAPKNFFADVSKIKNLLGHTNEISMEEGIKRTIDWYLFK